MRAVGPVGTVLLGQQLVLLEGVAAGDLGQGPVQPVGEVTVQAPLEPGQCRGRQPPGLQEQGGGLTQRDQAGAVGFGLLPLTDYIRGWMLPVAKGEERAA